MIPIVWVIVILLGGFGGGMVTEGVINASTPAKTNIINIDNKNYQNVKSTSQNFQAQVQITEIGGKSYTNFNINLTNMSSFVSNIVSESNISITNGKVK